MNNKELLGDQTNIEILRLLQKDPRMSISELARQIKMSNPAAERARCSIRGEWHHRRLPIGARPQRNWLCGDRLRQSTARRRANFLKSLSWRGKFLKLRNVTALRERIVSS